MVLYGEGLDNDVINGAVKAIREADMCSKKPVPPKGWPHFLQLRALLAQIREEDPCLSLKDLAVNGHDLMELGIRGKAIGETLNRLLETVMDEELPNEKAALLHYIKNTL